MSELTEHTWGATKESRAVRQRAARLLPFWELQKQRDPLDTGKAESVERWKVYERQHFTSLFLLACVDASMFGAEVALAESEHWARFIES